MQNSASSNKIKENKYKILRMSLLLGADANREETLNNFEIASREIDAMNDEIYLKDLEEKFYDTLKLEDEEKKLTSLVDYIGGRVEQRISLLSDFANVTGYDLQELPPIKHYDKLDDYKERLNYIREYLQNTEQIEKLNQEITSADNRLNESYITKATSEETNMKNENLLKNKFESLLKSIDVFNDITEENIKEKLSEISCKVEESRKSLDIFTKSFATLSNSGISLEEEQEYLSYVEGAEEAFYDYKEQEYLLKIYNLLIIQYSSYNDILAKREEINDILYERLNLRKELKIPGTDILTNIYDMLEKQYEDIKRQSTNINKIEKLNEEINSKKERLNELTLENQKVEILSLLREFCIIDTYEDEEINKEPSEETMEDSTMEQEFNCDLPLTSEESLAESTNDLFDDNSFILEKESKIEKSEEELSDVQTEELKNNQVINVEEATNIDLELIHSKASKVMQRVGEMLGIKTDETKIVTVTNEEEQSAEENISDIEEQNNNIENPLFSNDIDSTIPLDPEFEKAINLDDNNDFWFPSDTPDALNELPDLEISNDTFFANSNMSDLQFPDLNIDFGNNDSEGK